MTTIPGMILYEGPSLLTGEPIVVIAVVDKNPKTGQMLFTYILDSRTRPSIAAYNGEDVSVCGNCIFRAKLNAEPVNGKAPRMCYVRLTDAELGDHKAADEKWSVDQIWEEWARGGFLDHDDIREDRSRDADQLDDWDIGDLGIRYMGIEPVRAGSYGDPAAAPTKIWASLLEEVTNWTGYTHQHRNPDVDPELAKYCMASVDTLEEYEDAEKRGWRPFLVVPKGESGPEGAILCPMTAGTKNASGEAITCANCLLCKGNSSNCSKGIWEEAHGIESQLELHTWEQ